MSKCYRGEPSQLTGWLVYDAVTTIAILCVTEKSLPADCRAVMAVVIASWLRVLAVLFSSPGEEGFACLSRIGEEIQWNEACGVYIYISFHCLFNFSTPNLTFPNTFSCSDEGY